MRKQRTSQLSDRIKRLARSASAIMLTGALLSGFLLSSGFAGVVSAAPEDTTAYESTLGSDSWGALRKSLSEAKGNTLIKLNADAVAEQSDAMLTVDKDKTVTIDLNGHKIDRQRDSSHMDGHVIYVKEGAVLTITDSSAGQSGTVTGGYAENGGGILNHGTLNIAGGTVSGNTASKTGGGICNRGTMTMSGGCVTGNNASDSGGGIMNFGTLAVSGGTVSYNTSKSGAGIAASPENEKRTGALTLEKAVITGNNASENGGGIFAVAELSVSDCEVYKNSAAAYGGGIYFDTGSRKSAVKYTVFSKNKAERGGGIFVSGSSSAEFSDLEIVSCSAVSGGGIYSSGKVNAEDCKITSCTAKESGGGLYCEQSFIGKELTVSDNSASVGGGAFLISGTLELSECGFARNSADAGSGGIYSSGTLRLTGSSVRNNYSGAEAGGIKIYGRAYLKEVEINGNTAKAEGGGVYMENAVSDFADCKINENVSNDGGLYVDRTSAASFTGHSYICDNTAFLSGAGGISDYGSVALGGNCTVSGNKAAGKGGGILQGGTLRLSGTVIIKDNLPDNTFVKDKKHITIMEAPAYGSEIFLSAEKLPCTVTSGLEATGADGSVFKADAAFSASAEGGEIKLESIEVPVERYYIDSSAAGADGVIGKRISSDHAAGLDSKTDNLYDGEYVSYKSVSFGNRVKINGDIKLIVPDGVTLDFQKGIDVPEGSTLRIFGQTLDSGIIKAAGESGSAGIGSSKNKKCGAVIIYGGTVTATGSDGGAGIGSGACYNESYVGGSVTVYGGSVRASGSSSVKNDEINGKKAVSYTEVLGAGIGGSGRGIFGKINILGGRVSSCGAGFTMNESLIVGSAGIGGGGYAAFDKAPDGIYIGRTGGVTVSGGTVIASSEGNAPALGSKTENDLTLADQMKVTGIGSTDPDYKLDVCRSSDNIVTISPCAHDDWVLYSNTEKHCFRCSACGDTKNTGTHSYYGHTCGICGYESYTVTCKDSEHGTVSASCERSEKKKTVFLNVRPDKDSFIKSVKLGDTLLLPSDGGVYSFVMPDEDVTVTADFEVRQKTELWKGSGTADDPYIIASAKNWNDISSDPQFASCCFKLDKDIEVTAMLGTADHPFAGVFDGGGHTIKVNIRGASGKNGQGTAPFRTVRNAVIRDLKVTGEIRSIGYFASGLVGQVYGSTVISDCLVSVGINAAADCPGGIVGNVTEGSSVSITGCVFTGSISGNGVSVSDAGAVCGSGEGSVILRDCFEKGTFKEISSMDPIGLAKTGTVSNCWYSASSVGTTELPGLSPYASFCKSASAFDKKAMAQVQGTAYSVSGITAYDDALVIGNKLYGEIQGIETSVIVDEQPVEESSGTSEQKEGGSFADACAAAVVMVLLVVLAASLIYKFRDKLYLLTDKIFNLFGLSYYDDENEDNDTSVSEDSANGKDNESGSDRDSGEGADGSSEGYADGAESINGQETLSDEANGADDGYDEAASMDSGEPEAYGNTQDYESDSGSEIMTDADMNDETVHEEIVYDDISSGNRLFDQNDSEGEDLEGVEFYETDRYINDRNRF